MGRLASLASVLEKSMRQADDNGACEIHLATSTAKCVYLPPLESILVLPMSGLEDHQLMEAFEQRAFQFNISVAGFDKRC